MSARSFKSVGWVAGIGAAALGCYMLSLQVAAERADLARVQGRILQTRQAIRSLQTELGTRGRLSQLESWNADVLALSAPVAGQYVENEVVLARLETRSDPVDDAAPVRLASAETGAVAPAAPSPAAQAAVRQAVAAPSPAPAQPAPVVRRASLASSAPPARQASATAPSRAAPVRAVSLLDPRTARELGETARSERRQTSAAAPAARPARTAPARTAPARTAPARTQPKD
jgi:hypothetical protein